jgi:hypothetical protein
VSDILDDGRDRPPLPRWVRGTAAAVLVAAAGAYGIAEARGGGFSPTPMPAPTAPVPAATGPASQPGAVPTVAGGWRIRTGACGDPVLLPRSTARPLPQRTGLRVLAGGARLVSADLDTGAVTEVPTVRHSPASHIPSLAAVGPDVYYTLARACEPPYTPETLMRLTGPTGPEPVDFAGSVDEVISGARQVWGVDYPDDLSEYVVLRGPDGTTLNPPAGTRPVGVSAAGVVGVARRGGAAAWPRKITVTDRIGRTTALVPDGWPMVVGSDFVLWQEPRCGWRTLSCVLHRTGVPDGDDRGRFHLGSGRAPLSRAVLDASERYAAFVLFRPVEGGQIQAEHVGTADVVVLDLDTGRLATVPGLTFPSTTDPGLAFSPDSRWLVLSVTHGDHGHLYAWQRGSSQVLRSHARLPGPLREAPPILVLPRDHAAS